MKKNKNLTIYIGAAILIYFLLPKKKTTTNAGSGTGTPTATNNNQLMRQFKNQIVNAGRKTQADVNGVVL